MPSIPTLKEKELKIAFKQFLLSLGLTLSDLDEKTEKSIADFWLSKFSQHQEEVREKINSMMFSAELTCRPAKLHALSAKASYNLALSEVLSFLKYIN